LTRLGRCLITTDNETSTARDITRITCLDYSTYVYDQYVKELKNPAGSIALHYK